MSRRARARCYKSTTSGPTGSAAATVPEAQKTYIKVGAGKLISDYEGNEVRGDNAWKNKDVEVTGIVKSVDKGPFGGLYVVLGDASQRVSFHSVHVNLKESEATKAAALNKGDSATFKGTIAGFVIGSVSIREAEVQ
jgi:tRNA_anti-like